jgi:hypothetical protein
MLSFAVALCYYQDSRSLAGLRQSTPNGRLLGHLNSVEIMKLRPNEPLAKRSMKSV